MPVSVSVPTILRTHTGGEKRVSATGDTLQAVIADLEANYAGITERIVVKIAISVVGEASQTRI